MNKSVHPGLVLREYLDGLSTAEAASRLNLTSAELSQILNGSASISAEIAQHIAETLGTSTEMWLSMQSQYDLWHAEHKRSSS